MAYDPSKDYYVLFGGDSGGPPFCAGNGVFVGCGDTWTYSAGVWTNITPYPLNSTNSPSPRYGAAMAYDAADGYVVLIGGCGDDGGNYCGGGPSGPRNATWEFRAGNWTLLHPSLAPPVNYNALPGGAMTYDPKEQGVVLLSGNPAETWLFKAGQWQNLSPTESPPASEYSGLVYDPVDGYDVLYGGWLSYNGTNETWTFSNGSWNQLTPATWERSPQGPRIGAGMIFDYALGHVVLIGGANPDVSNYETSWDDVWEFARGVWTQLFPPSVPPGRGWPGLAYDNASGSILLMGGGVYGNEGANTWNDTWVANGTRPAPPLQLTNISVWYRPVDVGTVQVISVTTTGGLPPLTYNYTGLPQKCLTTGDVPENCSSVDQPEVIFPLTTTGMSNVTVRVNDSTGAVLTSSVSFSVNPRPTLTTLTVSPNLPTVAAPVLFVATPSLGTPPFTYAWNFGDGSSANTTGSVVHSYSTNGTYAISVEMIDAASTAVWGFVNVTVVPATPPPPPGVISPVILAFYASPSVAQVNDTVSIVMVVQAGTLPYSLTLTGLPPGCTFSGTPVTACLVTGPGSYELRATVTDNASNSATANTTLDVRPAPPTSGPTVIVQKTIIQQASSLSPQLIVALVGLGAAIAVPLTLVAAWVIFRRRPNPPDRS